MSSSLVLPAVLRAAETTSGGPNHWVIGGIVLALLIGAMLALVAFGGGREHT